MKDHAGGQGHLPRRSALKKTRSSRGSEVDCRADAETRDLQLEDSGEPRRGWRHVAITRQRTIRSAGGWWKAYPDVPVIRGQSEHASDSLYELFPEARRIAKRLEFHHTPKHGSWLNMAEIEFSVLAGPACADAISFSACVSERNAIGAPLPKTPDANCLYPCQS